MFELHGCKSASKFDPTLAFCINELRCRSASKPHADSHRAELTALDVPDLVIEVHGGVTLLVHRGKTDNEGLGNVLYPARATVAIVSEWLMRGGITDGRVFRSVAKEGQLGQQLYPSQIPRIVKAMAHRPGLPMDAIAALFAHSAHVGAAQDMIACGIETPAILQAGRWISRILCGLASGSRGRKGLGGGGRRR